ncbi:hypothetical protein HPB47_003142 [Ixodes persulcatus]|uniref:Uncharacterized protein n=1 Tax=Ixodes persulcatus TaxID=34615 RepID=A0AC60PJ93_IXOPE|nr:hypothetical protein HPB47_003142 [Ixodes persulcatus]
MCGVLLADNVGLDKLEVSYGLMGVICAPLLFLKPFFVASGSPLWYPGDQRGRDAAAVATNENGSVFSRPINAHIQPIVIQLDGEDTPSESDLSGVEPFDEA